jgi:hypothetical protein
VTCSAVSLTSTSELHERPLRTRQACAMVCCNRL